MTPKPKQNACALERLYEAHGRAIYSHCTRLLRDAATAEDVTQEVFLRVRRYGGELPPPDEMRPWLFRIATNRCLNELRRRNMRARTSPQLAQLPLLNFEDSLVARNDARRFLAKLPPRARAITWLTHVDGLQQDEVAATLGVSRRTVSSDLSRVRERLEESARPRLALAR